MSNWFTRIFSRQHPANDGLTQTQREGLLDLFNFCMCADGKQVPSEEQYIVTISSCYYWDSAVSVSDFTQVSLKRARDAAADAALCKTYVADINSRLLTTELRSDSVILAQRLFAVDGVVVESEKAAYKTICAAFGWREGY